VYATDVKSARNKQDKYSKTKIELIGKLGKTFRYVSYNPNQVVYVHLQSKEGFFLWIATVSHVTTFYAFEFAM